jgi:hypothetical protein
MVIPVFLLVLAIKKVYAIWKNSDLGWLKQLKTSVIVSLPILSVILCFNIYFYFYGNSITHILKLHSAQYEKDVGMFYQENVGKVSMGKYVYRERHFPSGFPAYRAKYQLNSDSSYTMMVQYNVNPFRRSDSGYLYYLGDTTDTVLISGYSKWGKEKKHLWGNWYYYSYL